MCNKCGSKFRCNSILFSLVIIVIEELDLWILLSLSLWLLLTVFSFSRHVSIFQIPRYFSHVSIYLPIHHVMQSASTYRLATVTVYNLCDSTIMYIVSVSLETGLCSMLPWRNFVRFRGWNFRGEKSDFLFLSLWDILF